MGREPQRMRFLGERGVKTVVNEEVTVYRVISSADGDGYSISAEFNGFVEITHYDNNERAISRTYGNVSARKYKRFKIQICSIKEMYLIAKHVNLDNVATIMCSSYPIDEENVKRIKNKLILEFDDTTNMNSPTVFTSKDAFKIKGYIDNLEDDIKALYICCDSGESRSTAISAAVMRYLNMSDEEIWTNPYYHPNPLVYKLQCKAFGVFVNYFMIKKRIKMNEKSLRKFMNRK